MSEIVAISLFDCKSRDISSESTNELLKNQKTTKLILKPNSYKEFINTTLSSFNLQKNSKIKIFNFLNKEKKEISNESDYSNKNNNSIYFIFEFPVIKNEQKQKEEILPQEKTEKKTYNENITDFSSAFDFSKNLKTDTNELEKIFSSLDLKKPTEKEEKLRRSNTVENINKAFILQIDDIHNNLFSSFISDLKKINEDSNNKFRRYPSMTIEDVLGGLQKIKDNFQKKAQNMFEKRKSCILTMQQNKSQLSSVNNNMKKYEDVENNELTNSIYGDATDNHNDNNKDEIDVRYSVSSINQGNKNIEEEEKPNIELEGLDIKKDKDEIENQNKPIFIFENDNDENNLSKAINEVDVIDFKGIKIKNISKFSHNLGNILWFKEKNSDDDIYFYNVNEELCEKLPFEKDNVQLSENENVIKNIKLTIKNPKEKEYKIAISLMDKESEKILTEKPLEISIKVIEDQSEEKTKNIISNLKIKFSKVISLIDNDELVNVIKEKNFEEKPVTKWVEEKIEIKIMNKLNNELKELESMKEEDIKEKIKKLNYDEEEIRKWIKEAKSNNGISEIAIKELIKYLDDEFSALSFLEEDEIRKAIIEYKGDKDKLKSWIEDKI